MQPDIIMLCETFMYDHMQDKLSLSGYQLFTKNRNTHGGGVCIYIKDSIECQEIEEFSRVTDEYESIAIELTSCKTKIMEIYRIPNKSPKPFLDYYSDFLNYKKCLKPVIGTDCNLDLIKSENHNDTSKFVETTIENNCVPSIMIPTRLTHLTKTLIDNIIVEASLTNDMYTCVIQSSISDHYPCLCSIAHAVSNTESEELTLSRCMNDNIKSQILCELEHVDWSFIYSQDLHNATTSFVNKINEVRDRFAPLKMKPKTPHSVTTEPWYDMTLQKCFDKSQKLYRKWLRSGDDKFAKTYLEYKNYRTILQRVKRARKRQFYVTKLSENKKDSKVVWGLLNGILKRKKHTSMSNDFIINGINESNKDKISNAFVKYYGAIGQQLAEKRMKEVRDNAIEVENKLPNVEREFRLCTVSTEIVSKYIKKS